MATIRDAVEIERQRESTGEIHLFKEGTFWRAYEMSAWLCVLGLLSRFVGMLTDSRSFLSYPRHEYFRRLLCNLLGNDVEKGLLPNDMESLSRMVEDISYNNARRYFKFY